MSPTEASQVSETPQTQYLRQRIDDLLVVGMAEEMNLVSRLRQERVSVSDPAPFGYQQPGATHVDGVADYWKRGSNFIGLADGKKGTISCWATVPAINKYEEVLTNDFNYFNTEFKISAVNGPFFQIYGYGTDDANNLYIDTVYMPEYAVGSFVHICASWDLGAGLVHLLVNGVSRIDTPNIILANAPIWYSRDLWSSQAIFINGVLSSINGPGCVAENFFHPDYIDLSSTSNVRKFITASGGPVDLSVSLPFGPGIGIFYDRRGDGVNLGTGGNLSPFGAATACGSHP